MTDSGTYASGYLLSVKGACARISSWLNLSLTKTYRACAIKFIEFALNTGTYKCLAAIPYISGKLCYWYILILEYHWHLILVNAILLTISAKRARLLALGTQLLECKINLPVKINFVHILFGCKVNTFTGRLQYAIADGYAKYVLMVV